jgi:ubiquinone/menaquinone biosynthesis C-methylase UbiE/uncharacterized protein (DUF1330 family)
MAVYTIAQLKFTDLEAYRRYQRAFPVVLAKFEARLLVADEGPTVIEGDWSRDKVVIIEFPDDAEAMRFRDDPDYRTIAKDRKASADAIVLMVKGVDVPPAPQLLDDPPCRRVMGHVEVEDSPAPLVDCKPDVEQLEADARHDEESIPADSGLGCACNLQSDSVGTGRSAMDRQAAIEQRVAKHYGQTDLEATILNALRASGKDVSRLESGDLSPVDEFHTGGREATKEIAAQLKFQPNIRILDVGSGIGGPSRFFAENYGCHITGIDLTPEYVRTAESLARRVGLEGRVNYRQASALNMPFESESFDGAYMMHVGMNIEDKPKLFAEVRRVLKPGALLAVYDVMRRGEAQPTFPVPCAMTAETAFIVTVPDYRRELQAAGFDIVSERDRLEVAREFFRQQQARAAQGETPSPLGIHLLLKDAAPQILANTVGLFERGVLTPTELICRAR